MQRSITTSPMADWSLQARTQCFPSSPARSSLVLRCPECMFGCGPASASLALSPLLPEAVTDRGAHQTSRTAGRAAHSIRDQLSRAFLAIDANFDPSEEDYVFCTKCAMSCEGEHQTVPSPVVWVTCMDGIGCPTGHSVQALPGHPRVLWHYGVSGGGANLTPLKFHNSAT